MRRAAWGARIGRAAACLVFFSLSRSPGKTSTLLSSPITTSLLTRGLTAKEVKGPPPTFEPLAKCLVGCARPLYGYHSRTHPEEQKRGWRQRDDGERERGREGWFDFCCCVCSDTAESRLARRRKVPRGDTLEGVFVDGRTHAWQRRRPEEKPRFCCAPWEAAIHRHCHATATLQRGVLRRSCRGRCLRHTHPFSCFEGWAACVAGGKEKWRAPRGFFLPSLGSSPPKVRDFLGKKHPLVRFAHSRRGMRRTPLEELFTSRSRQCIRLPYHSHLQFSLPRDTGAPFRAGCFRNLCVPVCPFRFLRVYVRVSVSSCVCVCVCVCVCLSASLHLYLCVLGWNE